MVLTLSVHSVISSSNLANRTRDQRAAKMPNDQVFDHYTNSIYMSWVHIELYISCFRIYVYMHTIFRSERVHKHPHPQGWVHLW